MTRPTLLVAGLSVRQLAQAAAREGFMTIALDAFGDRDTRHAARRWQAWRGFDAGDLLDALQQAADAGALGWIAGSGFEAHLDLLAAGALRLPLLGTPAEGWRLVRDPRRFFPLLKALGLPHPDTRWDSAPADPAGWLIKDGTACGGWHVRPAASAAGPGCWQRRVGGMPMSAAFVADGCRAVLLGCNEQLVGVADAPFAWRGAIGPLPLPRDVAAQIDTALQQLVPACGLRGLGSLDFMLGDGGVSLLELNPRPGGTLQLYAPQAPLRLHLRACLGAPLPAQPVPQPVHALEVLYAPRRLRLESPALQRLARRDWVHDLPAAPVELAALEPVCSLSAGGPDADTVRALLRRRHDELTELLEDCPHELPC
ncbi:ATP-grasp domain-containing protein [Azohydromonas caseinilytica]|uniref:ATP-grasp domain-containing protein n=1 Tax=Azohydromonas caseinilytica TaxID=2728836 RepID=A0A848FD02_9BURK|nr:ATP-grasp domain-containing protein [Azohydromonas caseinilytica]NML15821.1 ATP-grasp domain-containing protein [Azohydromonas caseinilytica]